MSIDRLTYYKSLSLLKRKGQKVCKPGSVQRGLIPVWMTIHLGRQLPDASGDRPGKRGWKQAVQSKLCVSSLFGLASGGVYHAHPVTGLAVRSYRTFSPLPPKRRYVFCCTGRHKTGYPPYARALSGTVFP